MNIRYTHTNINARDWRKLSQFYKDVFGCYSVGPLRNLGGEWFERVTGVEGAAVVGEHIALPGYPEEIAPTFEIFTYITPKGEDTADINSYGFAHVCFQVDDVAAVFDRFKAHGGTSYGELVQAYYPELMKTLTIVYAKDPEGNAVEIMNWTEGNVTENSNEYFLI